MFIGPTVGTIIAYVLSILAVDQSIFLDIINLTFFSIVTVLGVWIIFQSQSKSKIIGKKKKAIKRRIIEVSKTSKETYDLLLDYVEENK